MSDINYTDKSKFGSGGSEKWRDVDANEVKNAVNTKADRLLVANNQTSSYTLVLTDRDKVIRINSASPNTVSVPTNASVPFEIGTTIMIRQVGVGSTTLLPASGVTINSGTVATAFQNDGFTLIKQSANVWDLWPATAGVTTGGAGDTTPPIVNSRTAINSTTIRVVFSEVVSGTVGHSFKRNGAALVGVGVTGNGTTTYDFLFSSSAPLLSTDVLLHSYNSGTGDTMDSAGNELVAFTDQSITNAIGGITLNTPGSFAAGTPASTSIPFTWTDTNTSPNEVNFELRKNTVNNFGTSTVASNPAQNATSGSATGLTASTLYYFWLIAKGNGTSSLDSVAATTSATTAAAGATLDSTAWLRWYKPGTQTYSALSTPANNGDTVEYLYDQMVTGGGARPNSFDLSQNTSGSRPTYVSSSPINSRPALQIASGFFMSSTWGTTQARPLTRIMVYRPTSLPNAVGYVGMGPSSAERIGHSASSTKFVLYGGSSFVSGSITPIVDTTYVLWAEFYNDGNASLYVWGGGFNGVLDIVNQATGGAGVVMNGFAVGWSTNGAAGYVTDMLVKDGTFNSTDRTALGTELSTLNGVVTS